MRGICKTSRHPRLLKTVSIPDDLPPLRDVISRHGLRAEKSLGQNFLLDQNVTDRIVRESGELTGHTVIEIGPGPGGLSRSILRANPDRLIVIEFDRRAVAAIAELKAVSGNKLEVIEADALTIDIASLGKAPRIILANLPYNIASPLLLKWLQTYRENNQACITMTLMFQKEVAERIVAQPGTKSYGRLSVISQWLMKPRKLFDLSPAAFTPPPKVRSSIVHFTPRPAQEDWPAFQAMERVTGHAFQQRRKMIKSSLKDYAEALEALGFDPKKRAENLSVEDYIKLAGYRNCA